MPKKNRKKAPGVATSSGPNERPGLGAESSLAYDPNKEVSLVTNIPMPEGWGDGSITSELKTCQETLRQMGTQALASDVAVTNEVGTTGIRDSRRTNATVRAETGLTAPPAGAVTPPLRAGDTPTEETGLPTGLEDKLREGLERGADKLREALGDLDIIVTIKKTPDGREIRIRSGKPEGFPTSEEEDLRIEAEPRVNVDVSGPKRSSSGQNVVRLVSESGGEPITILAVGDADRPTADDGSTTSWSMQAKNEVEQIGLINNFVGLNVAINIQVLNIQGSFS